MNSRGVDRKTDEINISPYQNGENNRKKTRNTSLARAALIFVAGGTAASALSVDHVALKRSHRRQNRS
jgi:hypothetical protein